MMASDKMQAFGLVQVLDCELLRKIIFVCFCRRMTRGVVVISAAHLCLDRVVLDKAFGSPI